MAALSMHYLTVTFEQMSLKFEAPSKHCVPSPPQGADKDQKSPDGMTALEAAATEPIKALLK